MTIYSVTILYVSTEFLKDNSAEMLSIEMGPFRARPNLVYAILTYYKLRIF